MVIKLSVNLIETNQKAKRKNLLAVPGAVGLYFFSFHFVQFMLHFISIIIEQRKKGKVKVNRSQSLISGDSRIIKGWFLGLFVLCLIEMKESVHFTYLSFLFN